jgi:hypothetical protein
MPHVVESRGRRLANALRVVAVATAAGELAITAVRTNPWVSTISS